MKISKGELNDNFENKANGGIDMGESVSLSEISEIKQYFITDENFKLLKKYQQFIFESTETSPSIRKIVNALITDENLERVKEKFIRVWK